jgi:hypothetical protein
VGEDGVWSLAQTHTQTPLRCGWLSARERRGSWLFEGFALLFVFPFLYLRVFFYEKSTAVEGEAVARSSRTMTVEEPVAVQVGVRSSHRIAN